MISMMKQMQEENLRLKIQLMEERETKYTTPPEGTPAEGLKDPSRKQKPSGKKDQRKSEVGRLRSGGAEGRKRGVSGG